MHKQSLLRRIKELDDFESSGNWNNQLKNERFMARSHFEKILLQEERALRLKSKFNWAKQVDANTKLFHSSMNARKAKNVISKLELEDGNVIDKEEDLVQEITGFFQRLYTSDSLCFRGIEGIEWQPITLHLAVWLERPFDEAEVKTTIFDCDGDKAPGPDGFTLDFSISMGYIERRHYESSHGVCEGWYYSWSHK